MKTVLKSVIFFALLLAVNMFCYAQSSYHINLDVSAVNTHIRSVTFNCDSVVTIGVTPDGNIRLSQIRCPDMEYWGSFDGSYREGKLKTIGIKPVDYYDVYAHDDKIGRLKLVGDVVIDYYDKFDGFDNIGKVKSVGGIVFKYYDRFDGMPELVGRLKSIGDDKVTYYTQFDGFDNIGKLKCIGNTVITYFDRFDGSDYMGRVKAVKGNTPALYIDRG